MNPLIGILFCVFGQVSIQQIGLSSFGVGISQVDIIRPVGCLISSNPHESLSIGKKDPLKSKALLFCQGTSLPAIVAYDLSGVGEDQSDPIREAISQKTQIPVVPFGRSGSHSPPDSSLDIYRLVPKTLYPSENPRYVQILVGPFVSVLGLVRFLDSINQKSIGIVSNFVLQLNSARDLEWSGEYTCFPDKAARKSLAMQTIILLGRVGCGNIKHVNPFGETVNKTPEIGRTLFETMHSLLPMEKRDLRLAQKRLELPLRLLGEEYLDRVLKDLGLLNAKGKLDFLDTPGPLNLELVLNENGRLFKELWG